MAGNISYMGDPIVRLIGGEGDKAANFNVHQGLLTEHSQYFKLALEGNFKEAKEHLIELKEDPAWLVACFVQWLYTTKIQIPREEELKDIDKSDMPSDPQHAKQWIALKVLVDLLAFAQKRMCNGLHNYATHCLGRMHLISPYPLASYKIAAQLPDSKAFDFIVDHTIQHIAIQALHTHFGNKDLPVAVVWRFAMNAGSTETYDVFSSVCHYHMHADEEDVKQCPDYIRQTDPDVVQQPKKRRGPGGRVAKK